jgi:hypothetical protein
MKAVFIIITFSLFVFSSCCPKCSEETSIKKVVNKNQQTNGMQIQVNQSKVTAKVEEIYKSDNDDFIVRAKIEKIEDDPAYPSIAVVGNTYNLIPGFQLDDNGKIIDSDKNKNISSITKLHEGDSFKAVITFQLNQGWYINEINP